MFGFSSQIELDKNRFTEIPEGLFSLANLEKLTMSRNIITSVPFAVWLAPKLKVHIFLVCL